MLLCRDMSADATENLDVLKEESGKSIGRLRELVTDLQYVTELEQSVLKTEATVTVPLEGKFSRTKLLT